MLLTDLPTLDFNGWRALPPARTVLLTVNARLGRALEKAWLGDALSTPAPALFTLNLWLAHAVRPLLFGGNVLTPGRVLSSFEETWLWEQVISELEADDWLLDIADAAKLAREAHALEIEWPGTIPDLEHTPEYQRYLRWKEAFYLACQQRVLIDNARYQQWLREQLLAHSKLWPTDIVLAGLDNLSPAWQNLLLTLQRKGVRLHVLQRDTVEPTRQRLAFSDSRTELEAAIRWAADEIDQGKKVALVIPDLASRRATVCRLLDTVLHPEALDPLNYEAPRRYNLSLGLALSDHPLVRAASAALRLLLSRQGWALDEACPWLLSPYLNSPQAVLTAASREAKWRRDGLSKLSWPNLHQAEWASDWCAAREQLVTTRKATPSTWAERFSLALNTLGWSLQRQLSSHEFQALTLWQNTLTAFARLDELCGPMDALQALQLLNRQLRESVFQPQSDASPPLQVLGLLETAGGEFDALWVVGLTDQQLPASPRPNPLLPARWQRRVGTPHSSSERESVFARQLMADMATCAPLMIASYPLFEGEQELRPSPLVAEWPLQPTPNLPEIELSTTPLEKLNDDIGLPLPENRKVPGGANVLALQAKYPLWAYAECRLGAAPLEPWNVHPDARLRGKLLHASLECNWQTIPNQDALNALSLKAFNDHIRQAIERGFEKESKTLSRTGLHWQSLERGKLQRLLDRWLAIEAARAQPFSISGLEVNREWQHGNLHLKMRLDRIDKIGNGLLLIDYKSGNVQTTGWGTPDGKPLLDVQLPLYATLLAEDAPVVGTAFACLAAKNIGFKARLSAPDLLEPPKKEPSPEDYEAAAADWQVNLDFWRERIYELADDFCAGIATNQAQQKSVLRYCNIKPFLRVQDNPDDDLEDTDDNAPPSF